MNSADNGDEDDLDIYSNLPSFHYDDSLHKLETINKSLVKTISELEKKLASLSAELTSCKNDKRQLEKNISSLYKSAKQEITRKDKRIAELTLKEVNLRASSQRFPVKQEISTFSNSQFVLQDVRQNNFEPVPNDRKSPVRRIYRTRSRTKKEYDSQVLSKTKDISSKSNRRDKGKCLDENPSYSGVGKSKVKFSTSKSVIKPKAEPGFDSSDVVSSFNRNGGVEIFEEVNTNPELHGYTLPPNDEISVIENVQESPAIPEFQGPRTTFSLRQYKKLFGVSPFKQVPTQSSIVQSSLNDSKKQLLNDSTNKPPCSTTIPESNIAGSIVEVKSSPRRLCDSNERFDLSVNNCDSIDRAKSRLIDNLELQRKLPVVESIEENKNHSLMVVTDKKVLSGKKINSLHSVNLPTTITTKALVHVPAQPNGYINERSVIDQINSEERSNDVPSINGSKSTCNDVSFLDKNHKQNNIVQILFGDSFVNKNVALNFVSSELEDEAVKCNKTPLSSSTKDIIANEEDIAGDFENEVQKGNVCKENSTVPYVNLQNGSLKERNAIVKEPSRSECTDNNENQCKKVEVCVNNDSVKSNGINELYNNENTKVESSNKKQFNKSNTENNDEHASNQDSCDSYVLEMTYSPPAPEEVSNVNEDDCPSQTVERRTDTIQEAVVSNGSRIVTVKENSPVKVFQSINSSIFNDKKLSLNDSPEITKASANVNCKSANQQMRDLFGDSPSKSCDNFLPETEAVAASNFCLFGNANVGGQSNETNGTSDLLDLSPVLHSKTVCSDVKGKVEKDENILISPDVSKSYSNFQEAFQQSKPDILKSDGKISCTTAGDVKTNSSSDNNSENLIDKENPSDLAVQKSSCLVSQNIKHILCDKKQNDFNINNTNERQCDKIQRISDEFNKCDLSNGKMTDLFSPEMITNKSSTELKQSKPNLNSLKISENSFLTSGDDSNFCAIKKFINVDDKISPIKTPCKSFAPSIVHTKADTDGTRFSENSSFNDNSTFNMIKRYSRANELVTPIKTPYKEPESVTPSIPEVIVCEEKRKESLTALSRLDETNLMSTVIKKDGITICSTSEHCDFKRERRMKKIIKFNMNVKDNEKNKLCRTPNKVNRNTKIVSSSVNNETTRNTGVRLSDSNDVFVRKSPRIVLNKSPINAKKLCVSENVYVPTTPKTLQTHLQSYKLKEAVTNINSSMNISDVKVVEKHSVQKTINIGLDRLKSSKYNEHDSGKSTNTPLKKPEAVEKKPMVLTNKYRHDMKRNLAANFERRSPSEYFNQQQKSRLKIDRHFHQRAGMRRPLRLKSPTPVYYRKRRSVEKKLVPEGRTALRKLKTESKKSDRSNVSFKGFSGKEVSHENSFQANSKNICMPIRRLSESPKVHKEMHVANTSQTCSNAGVRNFMEWKIFPLEIKNNSFNLAQKFICDKKIPDFITKPKINENVDIKNGTLISPVNNKTATVQNHTSVSRPMIICRRIKRVGERKLEDSAVSTSNVSASFVTGCTKSLENSAVKASLPDEDRGVSNTNELELDKRKHAAQKTHRCIVKTPLDFKNKFSDLSVNDGVESSSISSDESQVSDESWSPKKSYKKRRRR